MHVCVRVTSPAAYLGAGVLENTPQTRPPTTKSTRGSGSSSQLLCFREPPWWQHGCLPGCLGASARPGTVAVPRVAQQYPISGVNSLKISDFCEEQLSVGTERLERSRSTCRLCFSELRSLLASSQAVLYARYPLCFSCFSFELFPR